MPEEIFAGATAVGAVHFVWGIGSDQSTRQTSASNLFFQSYGESPSPIQSAFDSWGWTDRVPDGETEDLYEVYEGAIRKIPT